MERTENSPAIAYLDAHFRLLEASTSFKVFLRPDAVWVENGSLLEVLPEVLARKAAGLKVQATETNRSQEGFVRGEEAGSKQAVRILVYPPDSTGRWCLLLGETDAQRFVSSLAGLVLEQASNPILLFAPVATEKGFLPTDFYCVLTNAAAERLFSGNEGTITGKRLSGFKNLAQPSFLLRHFQGVYESRKPGKAELSLFHDEQNSHRYEASIVPVEDHLSLSLTDVTSLHTAQEKLRGHYNQLVQTRQELRALQRTLEETIRHRTEDVMASEERFRLVASATTDAIYDWELSTGKHWWSNGLYTQFGHEAEAASDGRQFWESHLHPEDRKSVLEALYNAIEEARGWRAEYRFRKADGAYAWVMDRASIVCDETGVPYRMLGSMLDVSALREAHRAATRREAAYFQLAESLPHIVWITDADGNVIYLNKQWEALTGTHPIIPAKLAAFKEIIHPEDARLFVHGWIRAFQNKNHFETECRLKTADGNYRWFMVRAQKTEEEDKEESRWNGVCIDVHERKTLNALLEKRVTERTAALATANQELEHYNRELQQFAFVTSHDLKEPLRKIQIFGKLVRDKAVKEGHLFYADPLGRIVQSSERLISLINGLLDFSQLSGQLTMSATDLEAVVQSTLSDLGILIAEKGAQVEVGPLPVIHAVPVQIQQVFQNLIANALKFSVAGVSPHIRITAERVQQKDFNALPQLHGPFVRISIADNGIGFDEEYLPKIFTLFQRLHAREAYEGTGIGLAIVQKIVSLHNGLITARSRENEGAVFILILPMFGV